MVDVVAVESRQDGQVVAAALAIAQPASAATLLACGDADGQPPSALDAVLAHLRARLYAAGAHFLQAAAECEQHATRLSRLGFVHLADLAFLVLEAERFPDRTLMPEGNCRFETVGPLPSRIAFASAVAANTFAGSRDCPRLNDFRSAAEIVESYRLAPSFDPQLWRLVVLGNEPVGCLFLTQHHGIAPAPQGGGGEVSGAIEISYMGLLQEHRGRGLGELILAEAIRLADHCQAPRMVLAVDRANLPAISLYHRCGWIEAAQESVWGSEILP